MFVMYITSQKTTLSKQFQHHRDLFKDIHEKVNMHSQWKVLGHLTEMFDMILKTFWSEGI